MARTVAASIEAERPETEEMLRSWRPKPLHWRIRWETYWAVPVEVPRHEGQGLLDDGERQVTWPLRPSCSPAQPAVLICSVPTCAVLTGSVLTGSVPTRAVGTCVISSRAVALLPDLRAMCRSSRDCRLRLRPCPSGRTESCRRSQECLRRSLSGDAGNSIHERPGPRYLEAITAPRAA